jgi:sarcosine oxidase delta subunit
VAGDAMNIVYALNEHPGILIACPHCKMSVRHDVDTIGDAIKTRSPVKCCICEELFFVFVEVNVSQEPKSKAE